MRGVSVSKELSAQELAAQLSPAASLESFASTRPAVWMKRAGIVLAGSALVAVCAHLAMPLYFTPVPLSLAPFAVLVIGLVLRPGLAASTLGAYLIEGALGLPVFSPTPAISGLAHLFGPTGGYLLAYPAGRRAHCIPRPPHQPRICPGSPERCSGQFCHSGLRSSVAGRSHARLCFVGSQAGSSAFPAWRRAQSGCCRRACRRLGSCAPPIRIDASKNCCSLKRCSPAPERNVACREYPTIRSCRTRIARYLHCPQSRLR